MKYLCKYFILILLLFYCSINLFSDEDESFLFDEYWYPSGNYPGSIITFNDEYYRIIFYRGSFSLVGNYRVINNEVTLYYPIVDKPIMERGREVLDWLFDLNTMITFKYDPDYINFNHMTVLMNDGKLLRPLGRRSPYNQRYLLDGVEVVKYDHDLEKIIVLDNLRMRESPSIDSTNLSKSVQVEYEKYYYDSVLIYKNAVFGYDAKTVFLDTIDGITAPWYRICIVNSRDSLERVWVFGGYVRELSSSEAGNKAILNDYHNQYCDYLFSIGIIKK